MKVREIVSSHVLVIGSGGAGVRAAIEASAYGDCVLVSKTIAGKGGCTIMAEGGYNAVLCNEDTVDDHYADTMKGGAFLGDPDLVSTLVNESPDRIMDLISWGAVFDVTGECTIAQRPFGGQCFPRTCFAGDKTGHEMMVTLMDRLASSAVRIFHEVTIVSLLTDGGRVIGAAGLDREGELIAFLADATVLATGGGTRVYDISTNSNSGTGDGYAIGYRAGAELIDMEQIQFHPTGAVYPWDARGRLVTEAVRGEGGILKNALGERFMERYDPQRMELSTRDVVSRAAATEIREGRGTRNGGVWLDISHLPAVEIEQRLPTMLEQFLRFGVDIRTQPMEVAPTAHHIMGGLRIDTECRTSLPGLFACGEVSGGVHGANRLGGNALAETQVFGRRAGLSAGKEPVREKILSENVISPVIRELESYFRGDTTPPVVRTRLQEAMWKGAGIFRDRAGLEQTRTEIESLARIPLRASGPVELAECCIVRNMLITAHLIVSSALVREESRGAHVRTDIVQDWDAAASRFGHTRISMHSQTIDHKEAA
jgi:fumarate reductase (CoM/CoB) subunit A